MRRRHLLHESKRGLSDLDGPAAVSFGRFVRRPGWIVGGAVLILLAITAPIGATLIAQMYRNSGAGPATTASRSTAAIISGIDPVQSGDWWELERRMSAGRMTQAEVDAAFGVLIQHFEQRRAAGQTDESLHLARTFVRQAIAGSFVSRDQLLAFFQAYYSAPNVQIPKRARLGQPIRGESWAGTHWGLDGMRMVWHLRQVRAPGLSRLDIHNPYYGEAPEGHPPDQFSGSGPSRTDFALSQSLPPGEYELTFVFDMGLISDAATMRGLDGRPGPADKWPDPVAQWEVAVTLPIQIVGEADPVVALVTDRRKDPFAAEPLSVEEAVVRPASHGAQLVIRWKRLPAPSPALSYTVTVLLGTERIDFGSYVIGGQGRHSRSSISTQVNLKESPPAEVTSIDLILTPDAKLRRAVHRH